MPVDLSIEPPVPPQVDEELLADRDDLAELEEATPAHVDESMVRRVLRGMGGLLSQLLGDPDVGDHWRFTDRELDELTPPLTAIVNRRPALRRAVMRGDELTVALVLAGYAGRNVDAARAAKEAREAREGPREAGGTSPAGRAAAAGPAGGPGADGQHGGGFPGTAAGGLA